VIAVGVMSGTSLDGIDAALVRIVARGNGYDVQLLRYQTIAMDGELKRALRDALPPSDGSVAVVAALHRALGEAFANAARRIAGDEAVDYVASHGQTLWHDGARHVTFQLGDAFAIREAMKATVCYDFRSADCAAGGHGAPLVPYVDAMLLSSPQEDRVALNVGGIANVTLLPKSHGVGSEEGVVGFDTGPGNMLIDTLVRERSRGRMAFDANGALAATGTVDQEVLGAMLADDYFGQSPPKTTGRERFGAQFLSRFSERLARLSTEDAAATLTELTAASMANAIEAASLAHARVIVSGGGARNASLMSRLAARLPQASVEASDRFGIPSDAKEAIAFAVLGYETLRGRNANSPRATGARAGVPLGAIAPHDLQRLLLRMERECAASS
jgi:anhydro-N-acetylmuramic acid kinase